MRRIAVISLAMVFCLSIGYADAQRTDYKSYPVKIERQTIYFGFRAKLWLAGLNHGSYCNIRYELKLTSPTKLQGRQFNDAKSTEAYFEKLH